MKNIIKIALITVSVLLLVGSLVGCSLFEQIFLGGYDYTFSDIVLTQTGVNEFNIQFTANCGYDDVDVYFTEGSRISPSVSPIDAERKVNGSNVTFNFTKTLDLGESYYLWLICGDKEAKISITAPSMFPNITLNDDGTANFNFRYTYGVAWDAFCDPEGKAIYKSNSPVFDSTATKIVDGIEITVEEGVIPADMLDPNCYYFSVSTAKEGNMKVISRPVMIFDNLISQIKGISAKITNDLKLQVEVEIPVSANISDLVSEYLQLVVKTDIADEIYVADCVYANGVATMTVDCTQLIYESLWYDMLLAWNGAIVMDVPKAFGGMPTITTSTVKKDGVIYSITSWGPDGAPESEHMLKVYFEEDTTRFVDEICKSYLVTFTTDPTPTLKVVAKFKDNVSAPATLAITAGDKTKLAYTSGTQNDDGTYTYTLAVEDALTAEGNWYDLRFFIGDTAYEMSKDSCIGYSDYAAKYYNSDNTRVYEFREWNGLLKLMFTNV